MSLQIVLFEDSNEVACLMLASLSSRKCESALKLSFSPVSFLIASLIGANIVALCNLLSVGISLARCRSRTKSEKSGSDDRTSTSVLLAVLTGIDKLVCDNEQSHVDNDKSQRNTAALQADNNMKCLESPKGENSKYQYGNIADIPKPASEK